MLSYNNGTVRPWRNRQTRTFEGRMGDRVSSSLTGRTNKTSRNACLFLYPVRLVWCYTPRATHKLTLSCIVTLHLCMQAYTLRYYGHRASYKYTLAAPIENISLIRTKYQRFFYFSGIELRLFVSKCVNIMVFDYE